MKTLAKTTRINRAMQVFRLANEGMSYVDACREVGMARSTFYAICDREPEVIGLLQDTLTETSREQLMMVLSKRVELLAQVIKDALAKETPLSVKLAAFKEIEKHLRYLSQFVRIEGGNDKSSEEILTGPVFRPAQFKFSTVWGFWSVIFSE